MLKILRLEFLFNRRQLLIVLAIFTAYFAYMAYQIDSPRVFVVTTSVMIGLSMPFVILGREDKFKTAALICSLPVRRSTVVLGKYAATWAAIGLGLGYALLFTAVFPFSKIPVGEILTARNPPDQPVPHQPHLRRHPAVHHTVRTDGHHHPPRRLPAPGHPRAPPDPAAGRSERSRCGSSSAPSRAGSGPSLPTKRRPAFC